MSRNFDDMALHRNKGFAHQLVKCRDCDRMTRGGIRCKVCAGARRVEARKKSREPFYVCIPSMNTPGGARAAAFVAGLRG